MCLRDGVLGAVQVKLALRQLCKQGAVRPRAHIGAEPPASTRIARPPVRAMAVWDARERISREGAETISRQMPAQIDSGAQFRAFWRSG